MREGEERAQREHNKWRRSEQSRQRESRVRKHGEQSVGTMGRVKAKWWHGEQGECESPKSESRARAHTTHAC